eukprot:IDg16619t1
MRFERILHFAVYESIAIFHMRGSGTLGRLGVKFPVCIPTEPLFYCTASAEQRIPLSDAKDMHDHLYYSLSIIPLYHAICRTLTFKAPQRLSPPHERGSKARVLLRSTSPSRCGSRPQSFSSMRAFRHRAVGCAHKITLRERRTGRYAWILRRRPSLGRGRGHVLSLGRVARYLCIASLSIGIAALCQSEYRSRSGVIHQSSNRATS